MNKSALVPNDGLSMRRGLDDFNEGRIEHLYLAPTEPLVDRRVVDFLHHGVEAFAEFLPLFALPSRQP
jgi:hypothetical protein